MKLKGREINWLPSVRGCFIVIFLTTSLVFIVLISACSKAKGPAEGESLQPTLEITGEEAVFPHKGAWADPEEHGAFVRKNGVTNTSACANACHGENLEGGNGPSCKKCHENWPHFAGWKDKEKHGVFVKENGKAKCATKCHGADFTGGLSTVSCSSCHEIYPGKHLEAAWQTYSGHGEYVLVDKKKDKSECTECHGEDYKGGGTGKGCYKENCHVTYPHLADWSASHGAYVLQNEKDKQQKTCATKNCHGENLGGNPESSGDDEKLVYGCADCHYQYPHLPLEQWPLHGEADPTFEKCKTCHGADLKGKGSSDSCYSCHKTYPELHQQAGWKTTSTGHGQTIKSGSLTLTDCKTCHGTGLDGGVSSKTCYSNDAECHSSYPHPPAGVSNADWPLKAGHGEFASNVGPLKCVTCHDKSSGDCKKCHHDNVSDWKASVHVQKAVEDVGGCKICHGSDFVAGSAIAGGCKTCHGPGQSKHKGGTKDGECYDEDEFPYSCQIDITYTDISLHGADYKNNPDKCKICHGDDLKDGVSEKSCFSCHDSGNVHPHAEGWGNITTHGVKYLASTDACQSACHGSDLNGGISKVSCSNSDDVKCHSAYPHWSWPSQHGTSVFKDDSFDKDGFDLKCAGCHGAAEKMNKSMPSTTLKMPVTNIPRCYKCHQVYPHLGFKDVVNGSDVDMGWGVEGHQQFFVSNAVYLTNYPGQDPPSKTFKLKSNKEGCSDSSSGACHAVEKKGPFKADFSVNNVCGALCHKTE